MEQIKKRLQLDKLNYYKTHLSIVNCVLPVKMTPMELTVLAAFMALEGDIALLRFGPTAKKIVMKQLELSPSGMSNYMNFLTEKGFLVKEGDVISIRPILIPEPNEQQYLFKIENKDYATIRK